MILSFVTRCGSEGLEVDGFLGAHGTVYAGHARGSQGVKFDGATRNLDGAGKPIARSIAGGAAGFGEGERGGDAGKRRSFCNVTENPFGTLKRDGRGR